MRTATVTVIARVTRLRKKTLAGRGTSPDHFTIAPIRAKLSPETIIQAMARGMLSAAAAWLSLWVRKRGFLPARKRVILWPLFSRLLRPQK